MFVVEGDHRKSIEWVPNDIHVAQSAHGMRPLYSWTKDRETVPNFLRRGTASQKTSNIKGYRNGTKGLVQLQDVLNPQLPQLDMWWKVSQHVRSRTIPMSHGMV